MRNGIQIHVAGKVKITVFTFLALIILYCLFALNRIKYAIPITINGAIVNNTSLVILIIFIIAFVTLNIKMSRKIGVGAALLLFLFIEVFISVMYGSSFGEAIYAMAMLVIPFLGFLMALHLGPDNITKMQKLIIICAGGYAFLTLLFSANYNTFAPLLGVSEITTYSRFSRVNMPIGSSITVSYFLNLVMPFCAIGIVQYKENKLMRIVSVCSLALSAICTALLNSRAAIIVMLIVSMMFMNYSKVIKKKGITNLIYITVAALCVFYYLNYGDIDRFINRSTSVLESDMTRYREIVTALRIFLEHPILGTGLGTVYTRIHSGTLNYKGTSILSDPHNAYVMLLSELGVIGVILVGVFCVILVSRIRKKKLTRDGCFIAKTLCVSILIQSLFGAHIINEPSYAVIFWTLLGTAMNYRQKSEL